MESGDPPEGVVAERGAVHGAVSEQLDQRDLGGGAVGGLVVQRHDRGDLLGHETAPEGAERLQRIGGGTAALERAVEGRDQHVVGLDRLKAPGLEAVAGGVLEDQRRRGVAHGTVCLARLALEVGRTALRAPRLALVLLVGRERGLLVDRGPDLGAVEAVHTRQRNGDVLVLVEQERGRKPAELQRALHVLLAVGIEQARGHDRAAGARAGGDAGAWVEQERHGGTGGTGGGGGGRRGTRGWG